MSPVRHTRGAPRAVALATVTAVLGACSGPAVPEVAILLALRAGAPAETRVFRAEAARVGVDALGYTAADADAQAAQVERALAAGTKVLVIEPVDADASAALVERAHDRGAQVIAYDRVIPSDALDVLVAHDSYRAGVLQAEAALEATHSAGRFVLLAGPTPVRDQAEAAEAARGHEHTLAPYVARGAVEIVLRRHPASKGDAQRTIEEALARGRVDAVLATSPALALAAAEALERRGLTGVFIASIGAAPTNLDRVCQHRLAVDVRLDRGALARTAADTARALLQGEDVARTAGVIKLRGRYVPAVSVPVELVTGANLWSLVVDSGLLAPHGCRRAQRELGG